MRENIIYSIIFCSGALIGFLLALFAVARDPSVVRVSDDAAVVKKPGNGLVLVAVPIETARRLIMKKTDTQSSPEVREARQMYRDEE